MSIANGVLANAANFNAAFESKNKSVASKTANYTATSSDYQINCDASGGSFTITLPAAASNTGLILSIKRTDQTLANAVTIDGNASETIDGSTTKTLSTQYEELLIICNGSNWNILNRYINKDWNAYTPTITTISGTMTNYTSSGYWRRIGGNIEVHYKIVFSGAVGTWAGPLISVPTGLVLSSTALVSGANGYKLVGTATYEDSGVQNMSGVVQLYNTTKVLSGLMNSSTTYTTSANADQATPFAFGNLDTICGNFVFPVTGWEG